MSESQSIVKIEDGDKPLRILEAQISNFRCLKLINLTPTELWNVLIGDNGSGKSSILEALETVFEGGSPGIDVVRHGEDEAEIIIHLGDGEVGHLFLRKVLREGRSPVIEVRRSPNGPKESAPMTIINKIAPKLLDPSRLYRSTPQERIAMLMKAVGLGDQLAALDAAEKQLTREREDVGRDRRNKIGELDGIPFPPDGTPDELVDTAELVQKKNEMESVVRANNAERAAVEGREKELSSAVTAMTDAQDEVHRLEQQLRDARDKVKRLTGEMEAKALALKAQQERAAALVDPDTSGIDDQLSNSKTINAAVANKQRWARVKAERDDLDEKWNSVDAQIKACHSRKEELLANAPWPFPGMGFGNGDITLNGCLWSNLSDGQRCQLSVAVAIALKPLLRFATLSQAVHLSPKNIQMVRAMLAEHEIFAFAERQIGQGDEGLLIEDGAVVGAEEVEETEAANGSPN